ncbi:hypothetical protein [Haloplanus natans]|uniref:hypothetical protein n=1 Tax=Haloplanus natans TaxID=376171 RepID=UPI00146F95F4|nr:hypothetical protein [Haloplanus natans]
MNRIPESRKLNDAGNSVSVTLPKGMLETFGVIDDGGLAVEEASPYLDTDRGVIGVEVEIPK